MIQLGSAVRKERKSRNLSQSELGALANVGINFVSQVEAGKSTAHMGKVLELLRVLGLELRLGRGMSALRIEPEMRE